MQPYRLKTTNFEGRYQYYMLTLIIIFGVILSIAFFKGMSLYGDDFEYVSFAPSILIGTFSENLNIFSIRLLVDYPIAAFIWLFGYTNLGAGAYDLICYAITIPVVFLIGKRFHSIRAGLISSFLFAIYPSSLKWDTTPSPMLPLVLLISLSVLFYIYARDRNSILFYSISGFLGFAGTEANPLAFLYIFMLSLYTIFDLLTRKKLRSNKKILALYYFIGLLAGSTFFGSINLILSHGSPYYNILFTNRYYSNAGGFDEIFYTNTNLYFYLNGYFPYNLNSILINILTLNFGKALQNLYQLYNRIFVINKIIPNDVGLFPYFALIGGILLVYKRNKLAYPAIGWSVFIILYMEFGSMSITHYFPIYKLMRFAMIAEVPILIVLGIAISELSLYKKNKIALISAILLIAILFATSLPLDYYYYISNKNSMYYAIAASRIIANVTTKSNVTLYAPTLDTAYIAYYLHYNKRVTFVNYGSGKYGTVYLPNCNNISNGSYVIIPSEEAIYYINSMNIWGINEQWAYDPSICGLRLYYNLYATGVNQNSSLVDLQDSGNLYYKP
ncbi:MAG: glycosyltransferase family 39 protein [Candidatus Micrarchaeaceae archaeon]